MTIDQTIEQVKEFYNRPIQIDLPELSAPAAIVVVAAALIGAGMVRAYMNVANEQFYRENYYSGDCRFIPSFLDLLKDHGIKIFYKEYVKN